MRNVAYIFLALGGSLCILNFYLSFLRYPVYRLRGKQADYRWVSGVPLFGSLLVIVALIILREPFGIVVSGIVLAAIDTGGLHWLVGMMAFMRIRELFLRGRR